MGRNSDTGLYCCEANIQNLLSFVILTVQHLNLTHNSNYYVTIEAVNLLGKTARAFSEPFLIDDTPPVPGVVVELSEESSYNEIMTSREGRCFNSSCGSQNR